MLVVLHGVEQGIGGRRWSDSWLLVFNRHPVTQDLLRISNVNVLSGAMVTMAGVGSPASR